MDSILSPGFFEFGRSGKTYRREETLSAPFSAINARLPLKDFKIHSITNDVVLVTYISEANMMSWEWAPVVPYGSKLLLIGSSSFIKALLLNESKAAHRTTRMDNINPIQHE